MIWYQQHLHKQINYEIYSLGRDCQEGGEESDADIASFEIGQ